jgi:signal transduction histidine kinase
VKRRGVLPLGAWLALGLAVAIIAPALAAGLTWWGVGARQQAGVDGRARAASSAVAGAADRFGDPEVRARLLKRFAALGVEASVQEELPQVLPTPAEKRALAKSAVSQPLLTPVLAAMPNSPAGKTKIAGRYETRGVAAGGLAGTLFVPRPSAAVRLAATCGAGLVALALAVLAAFVLLRRWVVQPLARLAADADQIAGGDLEVEPVASRTAEVAEVGAALRGMAEALKVALAERDAAEGRRRFLVGAVAHDLRTPLFTLRGSLEAIERGIGNGDQLRRAQDKATLLDRLVGDLFTYSRLEQTEPRLNLEPLDATSLARDAANVLDAPVVIEAPDASPALYGDRAALVRVLVNLLENAVRHARGTVRLRVLADGDDVLLAVEDDGPGIAAADLRHVFEPHFRADRARNSATGGAGLGLAIVERLTTAHGGTVHVENRPDGGARFVVRLPALAARQGSG